MGAVRKGPRAKSTKQTRAPKSRGSALRASFDGAPGHAELGVLAIAHRRTREESARTSARADHATRAKLDDIADVLEALSQWDELPEKARDTLVSVARIALQKRPGRGRSTDRGRRATLVHLLLHTAKAEPASFAFAAWRLLTTNAPILPETARVPEAAELAAALGALAKPRTVAEDPADAAERATDPYRMTAVVLDECGVAGTAWVKSADDGARPRDKRKLST